MHAVELNRSSNCRERESYPGSFVADLSDCPEASLFVPMHKPTVRESDHVMGDWDFGREEEDVTARSSRALFRLCLVSEGKNFAIL